MFSFGVGDYFFPMLTFNFTLFVTAKALGIEPLQSINLLISLVLNLLTLISLYYTHLSKEKADQLSLDRDLHGIPIFPFLTLAACFFLSLLVFFEKVDSTIASFLFMANILTYTFYALACWQNYKKLSKYVKCPICARLLKSSCDYCDRCGEPLSKKAKKDEMKKKNPTKELNFKGICPKCKANLLVGSKFCPKCGYHIPKE